MNLPYAKPIFENRNYKLTYDIKALFCVGIVFGINYEYILIVLGITFVKK